MKIQRNMLYSVNLLQEPNSFSNHSKITNGTLTFSGKDLIDAIVSAGMPDTYLTKNEIRNRRSEILFKINLFETFVVSSSASSSPASSLPASSLPASSLPASSLPTSSSSTGSSRVEKLSFDISRKKYLDSTEVGAINYWIGMILVTVLGQKKYNYDFMTHLSMIQSFGSKLNIKKGLSV